MGLFFAAVLMVFAGFFPAQTVESQEQTAALTGIVVTKDNTPVQGALVRLSPGVFTDSTDVSGRFALTGIPSGNYLIRVTMPIRGFEDVSLKVKIPREEETPLKIVMRERSYQVDEVVVVSKKQQTAGQVKNLPSYVTVIERSEFEDNATTVAEVIAATPSVSINVMGGLGSFSEVSLRGAYSNQVQVYIDGMLLNEAVGGSVNLGTIPLTNVESIEVWRSGAPAQFGGDAAGGAINIRTRDISNPGKSVSLSYGSFGTVLERRVPGT